MTEVHITFLIFKLEEGRTKRVKKISGSAPRKCEMLLKQRCANKLCNAIIFQFKDVGYIDKYKLIT